jgi:hypothetical protein
MRGMPGKKALFRIVLISAFAFSSATTTWACGDVESQVIYRVESSGDITMIKGLTRGGNNCVDDHNWEGPKILLKGQLVDATNCTMTKFLFCSDIIVSDADDPTLSPKMSLPYTVKKFPESFRISKDKFDEIKELMVKGETCVDVQLPLSANTYPSCLKQIKYREAPPSPSPSEEESSGPEEIVFPGNPAKASPSSSVPTPRNSR